MQDSIYSVDFMKFPEFLRSSYPYFWTPPFVKFVYPFLPKNSASSATFGSEWNYSQVSYFKS